MQTLSIIHGTVCFYCRKSVGESSVKWVCTRSVLGGWVDVFLLLNTHGCWSRLCKCMNLIFKRTALFFAQWEWTSADTWAINPGRKPKVLIRHLVVKTPERLSSRQTDERTRWLPVRSRSPERWRATRLLSWQTSSWCPHRYTTRRSTTPRSVYLYTHNSLNAFSLYTDSPSLCA